MEAVNVYIIAYFAHYVHLVDIHVWHARIRMPLVDSEEVVSLLRPEVIVCSPHSQFPIVKACQRHQNEAVHEAVFLRHIPVSG